MNLQRFALAAVVGLVLPACRMGSSPSAVEEFTSSPPVGISGGGAGGGGGAVDAGVALTAASDGGTGNGASTATTANGRTVQETDLYRVDGNRLYYLNSYRGLMVFDITSVDAPKLLGRSPIYGTPLEMLVKNGIATVVVSDWYGVDIDGAPFHGSIARGLDTTDPTNIKVLGDVKLGGWVMDTRVVGNVLYTVSEDYGWSYGWDYSYDESPPQIVVSSVLTSNGTVTTVSQKKYSGYSGIFNVTPSSILLAHDLGIPNGSTTNATELRYLDISDPNGAIVERGSIAVPGSAQSYGADNGRWTLDFADGKTAHVVACAGTYCDDEGFALSTVDFSDPDAPALRSSVPIASTGWTFAARFVGTRLYLTPDSGYYYNGGDTTPLEVYDLSDPTKPTLMGSTTLPGTVWNLIPADDDRLFALGESWGDASGEDVSLEYVDVSTPTAPQVLGTASFGGDWAWTPAAETFKAFGMDPSGSIVVLPFSGWSRDSNDDGGHYTNGLQLVSLSAQSVKTAGTAHTRGWVERGIFANGRLFSLSDLSLAVIDYTNVSAPVVTKELTLARNVVAAQPMGGSNVAEVSSDWWGNDTTQSEVRVLPIANASESTDDGSVPSVSVPGVDAQVFTNGNLSYIVTDVFCDQTQTICGQPTQRVQVVDLSSGTPTLRGSVALPADPNYYYGWGWWGFGPYDWYGGANVVQVGSDALVFQRSSWDDDAYSVGTSTLFVVDLSDPDAPSVASTPAAQHVPWWGNLRVVDGTLYLGHWEWQSQASWSSPTPHGHFYVDRIDLGDRKHPFVANKINVPGMIVGGSSTDSSIVYTIDYDWNPSGTQVNTFNVVQLGAQHAKRLSKLEIPGWVGATFVSGNTAYFSSQVYDENSGDDTISLHALDVTDPTAPVDHPSATKDGWGWLLGVAGDRAVVQSGWGDDGVDIYRVADGAAPTYDRFVRALGWGVNSLARQGNTLFLTTGYWGVETIDLDSTVPLSAHVRLPSVEGSLRRHRSRAPQATHLWQHMRSDERRRLTARP